MYCANCGANIDDSAVFCPECGEIAVKPDTFEQPSDKALSEDSGKIKRTSFAHVKKNGKKNLIIAAIISVVVIVAVVLTVTLVGSSSSKRDTKHTLALSDKSDSKIETLDAEENDVKSDNTAVADAVNSKEYNNSFELTFENKTARIEVTDVSFNDEGELTVKIESEAIYGAPIRNGSIVIPYQAKVKVDGEEISWHTVDIATGSLRFTYHATELPDSLVLFSYGNESKGINVDYDSLFGPLSAADIITGLFDSIKN